MKKWDWLKDLMQKNNINQQQAADALQWKKPRISELLGSKRDLPVNKVFLAARFFNLDLEELTKYNSGFSDEIPHTSGDKLPILQKNNYINIEITDSSPQKRNQPAKYLPISEELLQYFGFAPAKALKLIIVSGDAMSPTLNDRDIAAVDTSITKPQNDGMYLFEISGELFIKRLRFNRFDETADIVSDNSFYPPITVSDLDKLSCLGKVVAVGKFCA